MKNVQKSLLSLGISEHESAVYIALIELGKGKISDIATRSGVKRTTVYTAIENLEQKGLVVREQKSLKAIYIPQDPQELLVLEEKRKEGLVIVVNGLSSLFKERGNQESLRVYRGTTSIQRLYKELLQETLYNEEYAVITHQEAWYKSDPHFYQKFIEKRAKKGVCVRVMMQNSETSRHFFEFQKNFNLSIKLLPEEVLINTNLVITPRKIILHQLGVKESALVIVNKDIIGLHQQIFELLWKAY